MNRTAIGNSVLFGGLILAGAAARLVFRDLPNFAPVAAIALFAGYYFRSRAVSPLVPLGVMALSDCFLDSYPWQVRLTVYAMLALPALAGPFLRANFDLANRSRRVALVSTASLVGGSVAASCLFFLTTNFAVWVWEKMYAHDLAGLLQCYAQALPFFVNTLVGDLAFSLMLFGGYGLIVRAFVLHRSPVQAHAVR